MPRRRVDPEAQASLVVQKTLNETKPGFDAHRERCQRYDTAYRIWRSPDNPDERRGRPDWKPLLKVKYAMHVADQTLVSIVQGVPKARCTPRTQDSVEKARAMEQLLAYYGDVGHIAENQAVIAQQALVYGASPAKTRWLYKEADVTRLAPAIDPMSGQVLWQPTDQRIVECDRPDMQPWDVYDCWWDPLARDPDTASYVVLRCWPSKDDLLANAYNADSGVGMYRNLELLFSSGPANRDRPQTAQNELLDTVPAYRDRFEVWEIWRNDRLTVIGNKQVLLYDGPKPYWMPNKPVTISYSRPDFFRIEGVSETELMDHIQQTLHAEDNLRLENLRFTVQRGATVRDTVPDMKQLVVQPHFLWPVTDHDDVRFVDQPHLPPEAYQEHETLLSLMQLVTGVNPYVTGANSGSTGADQTTATGVSLLSNAAGRLLAFKADLISRRTWQRTWEQYADLTKQFLRSPIDVRIEGPGETVNWMKLGPADVYGDYDVRIEAAEESANKQQRRAEVVALLNAFAPYIQTGVVDPKPILRLAAEAFGFPSPESLFPPPQQQQPQAAPFGNNGGTFPTQPVPFQLGGQIAPQPALATLAGNAR